MYPSNYIEYILFRDGRVVWEPKFRLADGHHLTWLKQLGASIPSLNDSVMWNDYRILNWHQEDKFE